MNRGWLNHYREGLPGGGPWKIKWTCLALQHNTVHAAMRGPQELRCTCPRALAVAAAYRQRQLEADRQRRAGRRSEHARSTPTYLKALNGIASMPDLSGGACQTDQGRWLVTVAMDADTAAARAAAEELLANRYCGQCRVREACRKWVLRDEHPAGDWPGVYGGMTRLERRKRRSAA